MILSKLILILTGAAICIAQNSTKSAILEFSIDEVAVLNRQFLDFLLSYDMTQVKPSSGQRCFSMLKQLSEAYVNRDRHGLEWFDSWGKIPSGLYYGNGYAIGNYEQCRRFSWKDVRGQHCTFMATFPNEFPMFYSGLCVPQFCTQQVVQELYTKYISSRGVRVLASGDRCCKDREYKHSFAATILYDLGYFAVDTFFALSGMLASLALLKELDQNGRINPLRLYLRRYIRLTAPLAPVILLVYYSCICRIRRWKPAVVRVYAESCKQYWWSALLHVQNYVNHSTVCLSWTWYVSVEMQLYILAPALIYPMWRWGKRALLCVGGLAMGGIIYVFVTFLVNDFRIADGLWKDLIYYPTHSRMAVWLVGAMFGYILHQTKDSKAIHLSKRYYALGWASCFAALGFIVYATSFIAHTDPQEFSSLVDAFYESLSRPLFGTCVMWIIFACVNGHGGVVNDFLSSQLCQPSECEDRFVL